MLCWMWWSTLIGAVAAFATALGGEWWLPLPRTPVELLRYAERRLEGHPNLERVTGPVVELLRSQFPLTFSDPDVGPFVIPPPPQAISGGMQPAIDQQQDRSQVISVGPDRNIRSVAQAARIAKNGAIIEVDPGDYIADVAIWLQKSLTIRGVGPGVRLIAAGASAEGKAIWVFRDGYFVVENVAFVGTKVRDRNGAGIRFEGGHLVVRNCIFHGNESGILTGGTPSARLEVENSEFGFNGSGDGQSHGIYAGTIASLRVTGSYFHHGNVGHHIKSRARETFVGYSRLTDEEGGRSSYEVDLPNGGDAILIGNIIQQGSAQQNSVMVSMGTEGYRWPRNALVVVHNTLANDETRGGTFVRVWLGAGNVLVKNNLWVGRGRLDLPSDSDEAGNQRAEWSDFVRASRQDYRPTPEARQRWIEGGLSVVPAAAQPTRHYVHPVQTLPMVHSPAVAGALQ